MNMKNREHSRRVCQAPDALLRKLQRAADELRWFLWLEREKAGVLWLERGVSVSAEPAGDFIMAEAKTLPEAMRKIDVELAERARKKRERARMDRLFGGLHEGRNISAAHGAGGGAK